jgi:hypothetical protein
MCILAVTVMLKSCIISLTFLNASVELLYLTNNHKSALIISQQGEYFMPCICLPLSASCVSVRATHEVT